MHCVTPVLHNKYIGTLRVTKTKIILTFKKCNLYNHHLMIRYNSDYLMNIIIIIHIDR